MNQKNATSHHLQRIVLFLLVTITVCACKKDHAQENFLDSAKKWYIQDQQGTVKTIASSKGIKINMTFIPNWEKAEVIHMGGATAVVVPVKTNLLKISEDNTHVSLVITNKNGQLEYKTVIVTLSNQEDIFDAKDLFTVAFTQDSLSKDKTFTATVKVLGENFQFEKIAIYDNAGVHFTGADMLKTMNSGKGPTGERNKDKVSVVEVEVCTDWWYISDKYDYYGNYIGHTETYLGRSCEQKQVDWIELPDGAGGSPVVKVDCAGVQNGTAYIDPNCLTCVAGTTGVAPCIPRDIRNQTTDPCIAKTIDSVLKANNSVTGAMADIIKKFDANKTVAINIYDANLYNANGSPRAGTTSGMSFIGNSFSANITLGIAFHANTSKENLVATLIHEVVHAYLGYTSNDFLKTESDHEVIAQKYIIPMANYLNGALHISMTDAYALAWSGISDSKVYNPSISPDADFTMVNGSITTTMTKGDIDRIAGAYKLETNDPTNQGYTKGTPICQ